MSVQAQGLRLTDVSAAIGGHVVVAGVNLEIPAGARLALVGTNGAGKSTLLRTMAGIARPAGGEVWLGAQRLGELRPRERARQVCFVGQEEMPPAELLVGEMVALGRIPHRPPWAVDGRGERPHVLGALAAVGLADYVDRPCDQLSGGERRRAMIARGLAQGCPVLILDEPTNHLDIAWQLRLLDLLGRQRATVITAVHDIDLVLRHFDLVAVLHAGRIWAFGPPVDVLDTQLLAEAFGVGAKQIKHPDTDQPHLLISRSEGEQET